MTTKVKQLMLGVLMSLRRATRDDEGALTTEMMILTAVLAGVAIAAAVLLMGAMTDAAEQIDVNTTVN